MFNKLYEEGIRILKDKVNPGDKNYSQIGSLQDQLFRVLQLERTTPFDNKIQSEKNRILHALNEICLESLASGQDFFDLCYSAENQDDNSLKDGVILYGNIMGYSTLDHGIQDLVNQLIKDTMEAFLRNNPDNWVDFKGGYLTLFIARKPKKVSLYAPLTAFVLGLSLQQQFYQHKIQVAERDLNIGIVILREEDAEFFKIGNDQHLVGPAISRAKLLMTFSGEDHFFISKDVYKSSRLRDTLKACQGKEIKQLFDMYKKKFGSADAKWIETVESKMTSQSINSPFSFQSEAFTFIDHIKRDHDIYNFSLNTLDLNLGNSAHPYHRVPLEIRDNRKPSPKEKFIQRLVEADEVTILGVTNENLVKKEKQGKDKEEFIGFLNEALDLRQDKFWDKLQIIFPDEKTVRNIVEKPSEEDVKIKKLIEARIDRWQKGKRRVFQFLLHHAKEHLDNWEIREYHGNLSFIGNKFTITDDEGQPIRENIRFAPLIPGQDLKELMYIELTPELTKEYQKLNRSFEIIANSGSSQIIEWNIYGYHDNPQDPKSPEYQEGHKLKYRGLINRKNLATFIEERQPKKYCFPVVLVMLHAFNRSILQFRTIYNASTDFNKYSNISGRIIDLDAFDALEIHPSDDYLNDSYSPENRSLLSRRFSSETSIANGVHIPKETWEMAAIREVKEELGIKIYTERLRYHRTVLQPKPDGKSSLLFRIYSLELKTSNGTNELNQINQRLRPEANLHSFTINELKEFESKNKLNLLLQKRFHEIFLPIFKELEIDEEE